MRVQRISRGYTKAVFSQIFPSTVLTHLKVAYSLSSVIYVIPNLHLQSHLRTLLMCILECYTCGTQLIPLLLPGRALTGLGMCFFWGPASNTFFRYVWIGVEIRRTTWKLSCGKVMWPGKSVISDNLAPRGCTLCLPSPRTYGVWRLILSG